VLLHVCYGVHLSHLNKDNLLTYNHLHNDLSTAADAVVVDDGVRIKDITKYALQ